MEFLKLGFAWIIRSLFDATGIYSLSIFLLTIIFNFMILPLNFKQIKSTENMQKIQPELQALQKKYKNDKEKLNTKVMELYRDNNVNPLSGCLPLLIQMPIVIALFAVLREPMKYIFPDNLALGAEAMAQGFFWIANLSQPDQLSNVLSFAYSDKLPGILPIITAIATFIQMQISTPQTKVDKSDPNANTMNTMKYMMPFLILFMSRRLSAGLILYWVTGTVFRILQQIIMKKLDDGKTK